MYKFARKVQKLQRVPRRYLREDEVIGLLRKNIELQEKQLLKVDESNARIADLLKNIESKNQKSLDNIGDKLEQSVNESISFSDIVTGITVGSIAGVGLCFVIGLNW